MLKKGPKNNPIHINEIKLNQYESLDIYKIKN